MIQYMLHTVITLILCTAAFVGGVRITERHYREKEASMSFALEKQRSLLRAGVDRIPVAEPYVSPHSLPEEFGKHLKANGQATYYFPGGEPAKPMN